MTIVDRRQLAANLTASNKKAWDELYEATEQPVWGRLPVGFLVEFLGYAASVLRPGTRALDAGAGEGRNVAPLERTGAWVTVCDASAHGLSKVPGTIRDNSRRTQCDLAMLPYRDGVFDFVLMTDVVETLPEPEPALAEAHRVLARGGLLLCNIPGRADPIAGEDMAPIIDDAFLYRGRYFFRFIDRDEAAAMIDRNGFEIVKADQRTWFEAAHPAFRADPHQHISYVFLGRKR